MKKTIFNEKTVRLFVALVPDGEVLKRLAPLVRRLKQEHWAGDVRWLPEENIHLTLRFLGETHERQYLCLKTILTQNLARTSGFELTLTNIMFLPSASKTRVVAVGVSPCSHLKKLVADVENSAVQCGFDGEKRRFKGHITLGRCRDLNMKKQEALTDFRGVSIPVRYVEIVKSTLSETGSFYGSMDRIMLLTEPANQGTQA